MKINGIVTAMVTSFDKEENLNFDAARKHIDFLIEKGVSGLFILGTNGEFHTLNDDEKVEFAKFVIDYTKGRVPVYVGVGACGTKETITLAKRMDALKPSALSVITPYLVPLKQEEVIKHYTMIADSVKTPIVLYNIPANTGINIDVSTLEVLAKHENIIGLKDSSGDMEQFKKYIDVTDKDTFSILVGSDSKIQAGLSLGASGAIASTSNVIPEHIVSIYNNFREGNTEIVNKLQKDVDVLRGVFRLGSVPGIVKRCVTLRSANVGEARFPVENMEDKHDDAIKEMYEYYKIKL